MIDIRQMELMATDEFLLLDIDLQRHNYSIHPMAIDLQQTNSHQERSVTLLTTQTESLGFRVTLAQQLLKRCDKFE
jgi:hypothetical protein